MTRIPRKDSKLSPAQVAGSVKRTVVTIEDGKESTEMKSIKAADVLDWAEYPDDGRLVVITTAGERLEGELPKGGK